MDAEKVKVLSRWRHHGPEGHIYRVTDVGRVQLVHAGPCVEYVREDGTPCANGASAYGRSIDRFLEAFTPLPEAP